MNQTIISKELQSATGKLPYTLQNDYMFRSLFQSNPKALKGLLSALLHIPVSNIQSIEITNPIVIGKACDEKELRMDIRILLNNEQQIDLEMQMSHYDDWIERSVYYLSNMYTDLKHGQNYKDIKPTIQIGIMEHTFFPDNPVFYSQNLLMDKHSYQIYSDKFALHVLDLNQISLASEEDRQWKLDYWAKIFKATTWEELKMLAADNEYFAETTQSLYALSQNHYVRERCHDLEVYHAEMKELVQLREEKEKQKAELAEQSKLLAEQSERLSKQSEQLSEQDERLSKQDERLSKQTEQLSKQTEQLSVQAELIEQLRTELARLQGTDTK